MNQREEIPMTVEWIRCLRDRRYEQNKDRPREVAWLEDQEAARRAAEELGITLTSGPGQPGKTGEVQRHSGVGAAG